MRAILDFTKDELEKIITPKFRIQQIFDGIYKKAVSNFNEITNLPKSLRENLSENFYIDTVECVKYEKSIDGSIKYLFKLKDEKTIESVLLPMKEKSYDEDGKLIHHEKYTVCVSTQVGCKMGCSFCFTAKGGFVRNLSAGEIVGQILYIKRVNEIPYERRVNIVYMGMGEPLDNLENLSKAISILKDNDGLAIAPKRQTVSTSGLAPKINVLSSLNLGVLLAISLHATDDDTRNKLMPINKKYNINTLMDAIRNFPIDARKRVMFEYLVIDGLNDDLTHARRLVKILDGIKSKVNLIYFNPHEGSEYKRPSVKKVEDFRDFLQSRGVTCTIRESKGLDISAACGQLKEKNANA